MGFEELGVSTDLIKGLNELGIVEPTDIQRKAIPLLIDTKTDIVAQAQTGTGKTAAFGIPIIQNIDLNESCIQALILSPTRELGKQIAKQLFKYTKYSAKVYVECVYGGEPIDRQIAALKRTTHIVVATPGRLIDLVKRKDIDLRQVKTVVLDEADEMLSMGFKEELDEVLNKLSSVENKWLFSATIPGGVKSIISSHLSPDAQSISVDKNDVVNKKIDHQYLVCEEAQKLGILMDFLKTEGKNQGVLFCRTRAASQKLAKQLIAKNISAEALHGDLQQKERDKVMRAFKNKKLQFLVSTDVAARGIDVPGLTFVVHYQLPESEDYYTHRSGRTARAGKGGVSLALITPKDVRKVRNYERTLSISFRQIREK